jgi:hypothetical protein
VELFQRKALDLVRLRLVAVVTGQLAFLRLVLLALAPRPLAINIPMQLALAPLLVLAQLVLHHEVALLRATVREVSLR